MTESTVQAYGHLPIERLVDRDLLARVNDLELRVRVMDRKPTLFDRLYDVVTWIGAVASWTVVVVLLTGWLR